MSQLDALVGQLNGSISHFASLRRWLSGGDVAQAVAVVGDAHFDAAADHLGQATHSSKPREAIRLALGSITEAYFIYNKVPRSGVARWIMFEWDPEVFGRMFGRRHIRAHERAAMAASIALAIQWVLGESHSNRRSWFRRAEQHAEIYIDLEKRILPTIATSPHFRDGPTNPVHYAEWQDLAASIRSGISELQRLALKRQPPQ